MTPRRLRAGGPAERVVLAVAARCLDHPDPALVEQLPLLRDALMEHPSRPGVADAGRIVEHLARTPLDRLQAEYVALFDLDRRHALYLTYWTDGDTRRRGASLGRFVQRYRASGAVAPHDELPDHLPLVLDFAAHVDPEAGRQLLVDHRSSLELLRIALEEHGTPYRYALRAVCATLPGPSPTTRAEVAARYGSAGPPRGESVGLEPNDPRLLPLQPVASPRTPR